MATVDLHPRPDNRLSKVDGRNVCMLQFGNRICELRSKETSEFRARDATSSRWSRATNQDDVGRERICPHRDHACRTGPMNGPCPGNHEIGCYQGLEDRLPPRRDVDASDAPLLFECVDEENRYFWALRSRQI